MKLLTGVPKRISHKIWGVLIRHTPKEPRPQEWVNRVCEVKSPKGFKFLVRLDKYAKAHTLPSGIICGSQFESTRLPKLTSKFRGKFIKMIASHYPGNTTYKGKISRAYRNFRIIKNNPGISVEQYLADAHKNGGNPIMDLQRFNKNAWVELTENVSAGRDIDKTPENDAKIKKAEVEEPEEKDDFVYPTWFKKFKKLLVIGQHVLLTGPSGCGKTFLAKQAAELLGHYFGSISCSSGMREDQLLGRMVLTGKMEMTYAETPFIHAYENGGIFLFDELDAADENTLIIINSALANEGFHCPDRHEKPWVKRHEDFVAVAACNTLGLGDSRMYTGRNQIDGATLDRFRSGVIKCDYSDKVEFKLVDPMVLRWGRQIRYTIRKCDLDKIMSTRTMLEFSKQKKKLGFGERDWEDSYFADWSEDEMQEAGYSHIWKRMNEIA